MWHFLLFGVLLAIVPLGIFATMLTVAERIGKSKGLSFDYDRFEKPWWMWIRLTSLTVIIVWLISPFIFEFSGWPYSIPVSFTETGNMVKHRGGMFTIGLNGKWSNFPLNIQPKLNAPSVTLLTENPKVRAFYHDLEVRVDNPDLFYVKNPKMQFVHPGARHGVEDSDPDVEYLIAQMFKSDIYIFNNAHSKELANFFNPEDLGQQVAYELLIRQNLGTTLGSNGMTFAKIRFSIR